MFIFFIHCLWSLNIIPAGTIKDCFHFYTKGKTSCSIYDLRLQLNVVGRVEKRSYLDFGEKVSFRTHISYFFMFFYDHKKALFTTFWSSIGRSKVNLILWVQKCKAYLSSFNFKWFPFLVAFWTFLTNLGQMFWESRRFWYIFLYNK